MCPQNNVVNTEQARCLGLIDSCNSSLNEIESKLYPVILSKLDKCEETKSVYQGELIERLINLLDKVNNIKDSISI